VFLFFFVGIYVYVLIFEKKKFFQEEKVAEVRRP